jgi:hypothetical protein
MMGPWLDVRGRTQMGWLWENSRAESKGAYSLRRGRGWERCLQRPIHR